MLALPGAVLLPDSVATFHVTGKLKAGLVGGCAASDRCLVVAGLRHGFTHDGGAPQVFAVGTLGRLIAEEKEDRDRFTVHVAGVRRVEITAVRMTARFPIASVVYADDMMEPAEDAKLEASMTRLRTCLAELMRELGDGDGRLGQVMRGDCSPGIVANRLAALVSADPLQRQYLLELRSPAERLDLVVDIVAELILRATGQVGEQEYLH